jgi:hypothetical protein
MLYISNKIAGEKIRGMAWSKNLDAIDIHLWNGDVLRFELDCDLGIIDLKLDEFKKGDKK